MGQLNARRSKINSNKLVQRYNRLNPTISVEDAAWKDAADAYLKKEGGDIEYWRVREIPSTWPANALDPKPEVAKRSSN